MERLTVPQQNNAVESFVDWLKHHEKLGKEPYAIELDSFFALDNKVFAILKFQPEENSPWLVGVVGGYEPGRVQHDGPVLSEFEEYDDEAQEKCISYIKNFKNKN